MARKKVMFTIEEPLWLKFKSYCVGRKKKYSYVIEEMIRKLLEKSEKNG